MLKRFESLNGVQKLSLILLLFVLFCQFCGTSSAWLQHTDALNNHFGIKDYYVNIMITEPNWYSVGSEQAARMQPGMDIFKDPRVQNISNENCYIRMKYVILDSNGEEITGDGLNAIESAIKYYVSENNFTDYNTDDFKLNDGWYYYIGSDGKCAVLEPYTTTTPLFTDVKIPILKTKYKYFNIPFTIAVKAQAVFVSGIEDASIENVAARFDGMDIDGEASATSELGRSRAAQRLVIYNDVVTTGSSVSDEEAD